jgi:hypothetical protein
MSDSLPGSGHILTMWLYTCILGHWAMYDIPANVTSLPLNAGNRTGAGMPAGVPREMFFPPSPEPSP